MQQRKLLVVDDEQQIRNMYSRTFIKSGYLVRTAESAEAALRILNEEQYWVFFLDLNLPEMNGIELCRNIRKEFPMAIAYAVTGYASLFELSECRDAGFEDYFIKPVDLSVLLNAAEHAFEKLERWK